jgi:hypothetical protein
VSNASLTPAGGWYADPMDAAQLRWWDGVNWTPQTTEATTATTAEPLAPVIPIAPEPAEPFEPAPAAAAPVADGPGIYIPRNSVFKMADAVDGQAYVPEWSGIADISDEVALSGVPVQLALTATPSEGPPIPVSADAFPILGMAPEPVAAPPAAPVWQVEQPLATPIGQLFPLAGTPAAVTPTAPTPTASVAVPPVTVSLPLPAAAPAFSIAVTHAPLDAWQDAGHALSPDIFPSAAPADALTAAPAPTGALFPGLVPNTSEPVDLAVLAAVPAMAPVPDLVAVSEPVAVAEPVVIAEPVVLPAPVAELTVAEPIPAPEPVVVAVAAPVAPVAPQPVVPQPELYAGPALTVAPVPTPFDAPAPPLGGPVAEAPAGVGYEPLVARAIPQPVLLDAPVDTIAPVVEPVAPASAAPVSAPVPAAAPAETAWPAEGTYQPHPGSYVPFDPNAVHVEEAMPTIPFSSRDPFNPASTSRPAMRSYGAAPVGPSGSTYTPALAIILLTPLLIAGGYALLFQLAAINVGIAPNIALAALLGALIFVGIGAAQFDRNSLAKRGYFDLASPFWILLTPLVYLGVRASRLHAQGSGGIRAVFLWFAAWAGAAAILAFSTFAALTAVTPDRIAQSEQMVGHFASPKVVASVQCPGIASFASGTVFNCTVTAGSTVQLVQVTVTDWLGSESYRVVSTTTTPAATAPTAP